VVRSDALELWTRPEDEVFYRNLMESEHVAARETLVFFGVSARHPRRTWPVANFVELARRLHRDFDARIVISGNETDAAVGRRLTEALGPSVINAGSTTLREMACLIRHCRIFIGVDSSPKHFAAAAGVPVIEISCHPKSGDADHPYSPVSFGPWRVPHAVVQPETAIRPCSAACIAGEPHCINQVTVDMVAQAVRSLTKRNGSWAAPA
jgi:heptosyltransferase-2